jgi:UDP-glucose 4-epimerase
LSTELKAVVTGAGGFIGANLARKLCRDGYQVHLVVRPQSDRWRLNGLAEHAEVHEMDLIDAAAVRRLINAVEPDLIFHAAAHGAYPAQRDLHRMLAVNVLGTVNLLGACLERGFTGFVHTGSSSEYGFKDHAPREDEYLEPNSEYAVTKAAATLYCRHVAIDRGVNVTTLRLYSAYGPWEEPTRLIPTLIAKGLVGKLPDLASPDVARDYVYVDDVVDACVVTATAGEGEIYNLGTGVQTTLSDAVEIARHVMGIDAEPRWGSMSERTWDTPVWVANPGHLERKLGWQARVGFTAGLRQTVDWLRETPGMLEFYRARQEGA